MNKSILKAASLLVAVGMLGAALGVVAVIGLNPFIPGQQDDHYGSPAYQGFDVSYLATGTRTDSVIWVCDKELDGHNLQARAWDKDSASYTYVRDIDGVGGDCGFNETNKNPWYAGEP